MAAVSTEKINTHRRSAPIASAMALQQICTAYGGTTLGGERFTGIRDGLRLFDRATARRWGRAGRLGVAAAALGIVAGSFVGLSGASASDPCAAAANPVACENQKT